MCRRAAPSSGASVTARPLAVGFDTETHLIAPGRNVPRAVCLSLAGDDSVPAAVGAALVAHGSDHVYVEHSIARGWRALCDATALASVVPWLFSAGVVAVGHNAAYDLAVLVRACPFALRDVFRAVSDGRVVDTLLRERLLCTATGEIEFRRHADGSATRTDYTLAGLVARYLGHDRTAAKTAPDAWRLRYAELDGVPLRDWPTEAISYPLDDARDPLDVARAQGERGRAVVGGYTVIEDGGPLGRRVVSEARAVATSFALHLQSSWGVRIDPARAASTLAEWRERSEAGRAVAARRGWVRVAGRDPGKPGSLNKRNLQDAVRRAMLRGAVEPREWMTKPSKTFPAGQVKVSEEVVLLAAEHASPDPEGDDLRAFAESIEYSGHLSRWGATLASPSVAAGLAQTGWRASMLASGRWGVSSPPWQQPPRHGGLRECVEARPGYVLCSVDYGGAELAAWAQVCTWAGLGSRMGEVIRDAGGDAGRAHATTAAAIRTAEGRPTTTDEVIAAMKAGDTETKLLRQVGKHANFGLLGGMGPPGFAALVRRMTDGAVHLDVGRATTVRDAWLATWESRGYFAWVQAVAGDGYMRHPVSGRVRATRGVTSAYNSFFQGLVADAATTALWVLACAAYGADPPGYLDGADSRVGEWFAAFAGSRPVLFLHDEVIAELPVDRAHEAAEAMAGLMLLAFRLHVPDVPVRAEPAIMRRWSKDAETVRDATGRLVVWEPS